MEIGLIGLGKMGFNLALNLRNQGFTVVATDSNPAAIASLSQEANIRVVNQAAAVANMLSPRRVIWLMVPAGSAVDAVIAELLPHLQPNDILIDGGNSHFKDSVKRYEQLKTQGIQYIDCGTSGGTSGALHGACTMYGGDAEPAAFVAPILQAISVENGSLYCGAAGSGHFVKMVHNGIEYGMMQAIAEGFEVMETSDYSLDLQAVATLFNHGSVVRSWLMELVANALRKDAHLDGIKGIMHASGEGKWTLETALDMGVPTPVIALSVLMRQRSQQADTFSGKIVAALRNEFGGHAVEKAS